MEWLNYYFIQNFILLCIFVVVIVNLIQNYNIDKKTNFYSIVVMIVTILLSIAITLENYGKSIASIPLTTAFSVFGYVVRPVVTYLFIKALDIELMLSLFRIIVPIIEKFFSK